MSKGSNLWYLIWSAAVPTSNTLPRSKHKKPDEALVSSVWVADVQRRSQVTAISFLSDLLVRTFKEEGNVLLSLPKTDKNPPKTRADGPTTHLSLFPLCMSLPFTLSLQNANCLLDEINIKGEDGKRERRRELRRGGSCRSLSHGGASGTDLSSVLINGRKLLIMQIVSRQARYKQRGNSGDEKLNYAERTGRYVGNSSPQCVRLGCLWREHFSELRSWTGERGRWSEMKELPHLIPNTAHHELQETAGCCGRH